MPTANAQFDNRGQRLELLIVGRVLLTIGVASLTVGAAIAAALLEGVSPAMRTILGLAVAATMVAGGEMLSRRSQKNLVFWLSTNLMSAGYFLAYFFIYSLYYVPGLHVVETPYLCWILGPVLAGIATWHGSQNRAMRWVTPVFTMLVTGHALFQALSSTLVVHPFGFEVKVAALGCFFGMLWCAGLSAVYKRFQLRYNWPGTGVEEAADYLFNRVAHELYFIAAALNAMALPLFLADFAQAPLWWSVEAPILLGLLWRLDVLSHRGQENVTGSNVDFVKHAVVGAIWAAAALMLLSNAYRGLPISLAIQLSVPISGLVVGLGYRLLKTTWVSALKVAGYCAYLYLGLVVALVVPYLQFGNVWDAMPFWMVQSLVICGLGLALRDRLVHQGGFVVGALSLVLFGLQFRTWDWWLVGPVVACSYALSVAYAVLSTKEAWRKATDFLPFGYTETVSQKNAEFLETVWSWVGCLTLLGASFLLLNQANTTLWWSGEALLMVTLGFIVSKSGFRYQGLLALGLAAGKLGYDLVGGFHGWHPEDAFTMFRALQFTVFGASSFLASLLYFREEARLEAQVAQPAATGDTGNGGTGEATLPPPDGHEGN